MAYDRISPIGPEREDWRTALLACVMSNLWRGKGQRTAKMADFMPQFRAERKWPSVEEIKRRMRTWLRGVKEQQERRKQQNAQEGPLEAADSDKGISEG